MVRARDALEAPLEPPPWRLPWRNSWRRLGKALRLLVNRRFRLALQHGVAAAIEHRHLGSVRARTVVDVGAHRGQFSLLALELFPQAAVLAFEPLSAARGRLAPLMQTEPRFRLYPMALGREAGERLLLIAARDDCSSLRAASGAQIELEPRSRSIASELVPVARLDEVLGADRLRAPALLKIDVQGQELEVLEGALGLLPYFAAIYVEASFRELYDGQALAGDVISWLARRGFALNGVYNLLLDGDGRAVQADLEFKRAAL
jgi:FkbM family methyltransferase